MIGLEYRMEKSRLLAFIDARVAGAMYLLVALLWLVPDRRIERTVQRR